jgi:hypothetical protein
MTLSPRTALAVVAAGALAACEQIDSSDVRTHGMYADLAVNADGSGTSVADAELRAGGDASNVSIDLTGGDRFVATLSAVRQTMGRRENGLGKIWYEAVFGTDAENEILRIDFQRGSGGLDAALNSHVTLPAPFAITAPAPAATLSRADGLTVRWTPARTDPVHVTIAGGCTQPRSFAVGVDRGGLAISAAYLAPFSGHELDSCELDVHVTRSRAGVVAPAYGEGGWFMARQVRSVRVLLGP